MINLSKSGMRCRATREIRTHEGLIRRFTEGTIEAVIDNLGRQVINVEWDSGITTYFFSTRLKSQMAYNFLPHSSDLVELFEVPPRQGVFVLQSWI